MITEDEIKLAVARSEARAEVRRRREALKQAVAGGDEHDRDRCFVDLTEAKIMEATIIRALLKCRIARWQEG